MKKIIYLLILATLIATPAFAVDFTNGTGDSNTTNFHMGADSTNFLVIGVSSQVRALYRIDSGTQVQWYGIATYHLGGNNVYGTAQDITNIYKLSGDPGKQPGSEFDWSGMPADSTASSSWSSGVWVPL